MYWHPLNSQLKTEEPNFSFTFPDKYGYNTFIPGFGNLPVFKIAFFCPGRLRDSKEPMLLAKKQTDVSLLFCNLRKPLFTESALGPLWCSSCNVCMYVRLQFSVYFCEASHWPSDHMLRSRPLIGQPPPHFFC